MTNRTGKREREARNRHKRAFMEGRSQSGAELVPLKLGRKKCDALRRKRDRLQFSAWSYFYRSHGVHDGRTGDRSPNAGTRTDVERQSYPSRCNSGPLTSPSGGDQC